LRRKHAVTITEERAVDRIDRTTADREYIREEIRRRQSPEVDQWEQDFYGKGDLPSK